MTIAEQSQQRIITVHPGFLDSAEQWTVRASQRLAFGGVLLMLAIGLLSAADVLIMRALFRAPIAGSNEIFSTLFAVGIASVLAGGLASRATIEIDFLARRLQDRTIARLRAFGAALYLIVIGGIAWRVAYEAQTTFVSQAVTPLLQWKLWPFYAAIAVMLVMCVPVQCLAFWRQVREIEPADSEGQHGGLRALLFLGLAITATSLSWWLVTAYQPVIGAHPVAWGVFVFILLWIVASLFVPVAAALAICGTLGAAGLIGGSQALSVLGSETMGLMTNEDLAVVPLFLMMGGFAVAGGLAQDMYRFAQVIFSPMRGGLALATIGGCAGFGAVTGSSLATIATIGPAALPEMKARGYSPELAAGALVAGGTLGVLIPPSTVIVLYALLVEASVGALYVALLVPALLTVLFYMITILITAYRNPAAAPPGEPFDATLAMSAAVRCIPSIIVFAVVFGGMFIGLFTATEGAAVGTVLTFVIALLRGKLSREAIGPVAVETTRSTSMLYFVMIGALMITFLMGTSGAPTVMTEELARSGLPSLAIILMIAVIYIILGTVMDTITIMMITAPALAGMIVSLGYSPIWWGIVTVMLVEIGVVSPPFGLNLFMVRTMSKDITLDQVFRGVTPFIVADIIKVFVLILFPVITLWLPSLSSFK